MSFFFNYGEFTQNPSYRYVLEAELDPSSRSCFRAIQPEPADLGELRSRRQAPVPPEGRRQRLVLREGRLRLPGLDANRPGAGHEPVLVLHLPERALRARRVSKSKSRSRRRTTGRAKLVLVPADEEGKSSDPNEDRVRCRRSAAATKRALRGLRALEPPAQAVGVVRPARFDKETPATLKFMKQTGLNLFVQGPVGPCLHAVRPHG